MPGITSAETPAPKPQELFRPIDRDEFRDLLIDSSVGLLYMARMACGEDPRLWRVFRRAVKKGRYFWFFDGLQ